MTAPTLPVRQERDAGVRPVPWLRMVWVTWRQHRIALAGAAALLGALAVYLGLAGLRVRHAYAAAAACHPALSAACQPLLSGGNGADATAHQIAALLQVVPALIGAFAGAPVLARELETGTFRYAWTQGMGRWRWTVAKLVLLAVTVAAAAGAFGVLFSWYFSPIVASGDETPYLATVFDLYGVALAAWTLAAFAIGALAGMLIRRVVPAIAATMAAWSVLAITTAAVLRPHYMTPVVTSNPSGQDSAWIISQWFTHGGKTVGQSVISQVLEKDPQHHVGPYSAMYTIDPPRYLAQHGYLSWISFQPISRFWTFQWIEGGWLLVLSALLIATVIWLVRHRAA
jgi:ABC-type transport system involved in multi-copper enzyme maturation permease subunit